MTKISVSLFLLVFFLGLTAHVSAASTMGNRINTAFSKGTINIGIMAGAGSTLNRRYTVLGISAGYYITEGLETGIDAQHWFSSGPSITKVSPQIRYVFTQPKLVKPYLGAFYRRIFVDSDTVKHLNSYGYRAGAYTSVKNKTALGGGIVYERYSNCQTDCSNTYPEILFSIRF